MGQNYGTGFAQGLNASLRIIETARRHRREDKKIADEKQFETIRDTGLDAAKTARESDINSQIETTDTVNEGAFDQPADQYKVGGNTYDNKDDALSAQQEAQSLNGLQNGTDGQAPDIKETMGSRLELPKWEEKTTVGDKEYKTKDEARKAAEKNVGSSQDYFMEKAVPYMKEAYMKANQPEKAMAFEKWSQDHKNQKRANEWLDMRKAQATGNMKVVGDFYMKQFNEAGGEQAKSMTPLYGEDKSFQGFDVVVAGEDGNERNITYTPDMIESGAMATSPAALMKLDTDRATAEAASAAELAKENRKNKFEIDKIGLNQKNTVANKVIDAQINATQTNAQYARDVQLKQIGWDFDKLKADNDFINSSNLEKVKSDLKNAEDSGKVSKVKRDMKVAGLDEAEADAMVKKYLPRILGLSYASDTFNPDEARAKIVAGLARDPMFARKSKEVQQDLVNNLFELVTGGQKPVDMSLTPQSPAAAGMPRKPNQTPSLSRP